MPKFLAPIDLTKLEIRNAVLQQLGADPGSPVEGLFFELTSDKVLRIYLDGGFVSLGRLDKITAPGASLNLNSQKIINLLDGSGAADGVNKGQLDAVATAAATAVAAVASGISWKDSVRAVVTTNGTLATAFENGDAAGGVTLATGDRILLAGQTAPAENGIRVVAASGTPARATDSDTAADVLGTFVPVEEGTGASKVYYLATDAPITLDTTSLTFTEWTGAVYTAGAGLTLTGVDFAVGAGTGITVGANDVAIDTAVVVRKFAADIGNGTDTSITVTHNLGTKDITYVVYDKTTPFEALEVTPKHATTNTLTLEFAIAPTTDQYRVVVHG